MKRILAFVLAALILSVSALCACGSDNEKNSTPDETTKTAQTASEKSTQTAGSVSSGNGSKETTAASGQKSAEKSTVTADDDEGELPLVGADDGEGAIVNDDSSDSSGKSNSSSSSGNSSNTSGSSGSGGNSSSADPGKTDSTVSWNDIVKEGEEYGDELPFVPAY